MTNWVITIPKTVRWDDYLRELDAASRGEILNYRLSFKPRAIAGDRCYVLHDGYIKGWMNIIGVEFRDDFVCTTTSKLFNKGWCIQRSGEFHKIKEIPMKGFRGIRRL